MEEPLFVGRETELARLTELLKRGAQGQGGIAFVRGEAGVGKSMLLEALQRQVSNDPDLGDASFAQAIVMRRRACWMTASMRFHRPERPGV